MNPPLHFIKLRCTDKKFISILANDIPFISRSMLP